MPWISITSTPSYSLLYNDRKHWQVTYPRKIGVQQHHNVGCTDQTCGFSPPGLRISVLQWRRDRQVHTYHNTHQTVILFKCSIPPHRCYSIMQKCGSFHLTVDRNRLRRELNDLQEDAQAVSLKLPADKYSSGSVTAIMQQPKSKQISTQAYLETLTTNLIPTNRYLKLILGGLR